MGLVQDNGDEPLRVPDKNRTRFRLAARGLVSGVLVFLLAWCVLGVVACVLVPSDPTGNPTDDAARQPVSDMVGAVVIGVSAILGLVEAILASRAGRR